jgi:rhodanese-related sulfurtransferase
MIKHKISQDKGYVMRQHIAITTFFISSLLFARTGFEYEGIPIKVSSADGKPLTIIVKRDIAQECQKLPINNDMVWTGNYANEKVPKACKSTYVHTTGKLLPMQIDEDVETYGELEVLAFMKEMQSNTHLILVDGRKEEWYAYRTIPGAINLPFHHFKEREAFEFEFEHDLQHLSVTLSKKGEYDFSEAKGIVVFCNGPWCSQSVAMIEALLTLGYPAEKIKWYRGGMQDWLSAGMTSTRP